ncbi:MAG: ATP-binding cassette domain-containing protein [Bdellovibrionaceae bacterium]|nr:ATP-binding cassette domain-containing protein [Pseudobdellovibrionaceae bacterium]
MSVPASPSFTSSTYRRLAGLARTERAFLAWGMLFLILSSGAGLVYPQLVRWMVDNVLQPKNYALLNQVVIALFAAFTLQALTSSARYYFFTLAGERIVLRLRRDLFHRILNQDIAFFDFNRTGELMSRLASDCTTLQNTVSVNISQGLRNLGQVVGGLGFMFYTSWKLSLVMLVLVPPVAVFANFFGKRIRQHAKNFQQSIADASIVAEESISGVRTVKSFVQESTELERYDGALGVALTTAKARITSIAQFMTLAMLIGFAAVSFVLWYGGREVVLGSMSVGDLTQFLLYLMIVAIGVGSLGSLWGDMMAGVGASERVFDILERDSEIHGGGRKLERLEGRIEFRDVEFAYPSRADVPVLRQMNFHIEPGEAVALVGGSGGGKTTVASLLTRFYDPRAGSIEVDGVNLREFDLAWLRERIGIVSQEPVLISSTIEENIRYGRPEATTDEVIAAARSANAHDFIAAFPEGYRTLVGEKGIQLSGGQKQRVAIARALLKDPRILILDEATSNLDTASEHLVQEALSRLMKGRTTLIIAHRLATVKDADRIFVLDQGQIQQVGSHEELAADRQGLYFQLLQRQFITRSATS